MHTPKDGSEGMKTHGALTEDSVSQYLRTHDGKGREWKGREYAGHLSRSTLLVLDLFIPIPKRSVSNARGIDGGEGKC